MSFTNSMAILAIATSAIATSASAGSIFFEDFDEAPFAANNFTGFDQFTVSNGSVDAFTNAGFSLPCPTLGCVDLDGSSADAGDLTSTAISFVAGTAYELSFNVAGNQRGGAADNFDVSISQGLVAPTSFTLQSDDGFRVETLAFTATADVTASILFSHAGGDNVGVLLDFVNVEALTTAVPLPAAAPMLMLALGGLGFMARRRR